MLKKGSFINKKYYQLLLCNLLTSGSYGVNIMIDSLVGGNQLGETVLSAVSIVNPIFSMVIFCSYLFSQGFSIIYGKYVGEFDDDKANKIAGQSLLASLLSSVIMLAFLFVLKEPFLAYYECTGALYEAADIYYKWAMVYIMLYPVNMCLYRLVLTDGDGIFSMLGSIGEIIIHVSLSIILCKTIGIRALGLSTCIGTVVSISLYLCHFLLKTNSIHFKLYWSMKELKNAFVLSFSTSINFIFVALVDTIMNKVILVSCGMEMIPAYSVINLMFNIYFIFEAVFDSSAGFCSTFLGEKNNYGIVNIMNTCKRSIRNIGILLTVVCFVGAPLVPEIYGMSTPIVVETSISAARIMSFAALPYGFATLGYMAYPALGKSGLSVFMAFLFNFFCPLVLSIPFAFMFGFTGVSIGMASSSYLVIIIFLVIIIKKYGKKNFPLYLQDYQEEVMGFDISVNNKSITNLKNNVIDALDKHGYNIKNIDLLINELYSCMMNNNKGKRVLSECVLFFGDNYVRIIIRDNGKTFNYVEEEKSNEVIELLKDVKQDYILTTSFNRNGFVFEK